MRKALVTTTINVPTLLTDYVKDFKAHGHDDMWVFVAGDKKTPSEAEEFCEKTSNAYGVPVLYMDEHFQNATMTSYPSFNNILPWNCIQRRNVAILEAYKNGAEIIYTIDDDNFLHTPDYIGAHGELGEEQEQIEVFSNEKGWLNPCRALIEQRYINFYPRGYSFNIRKHKPDFSNVVDYKKGRIVVNAGLWLGEPDIDAVTRLACAPYVTGFETYGHDRFSLGANTKAPFNSQNTALHRDVIPAYCLAPGLGRYDDIIAGYIVKRIADHLGDYISFGLPLVMQNRNQHDIFKDLQEELTGMKLIDDFVDLLYRTELTGKTYKECAQQLANAIDVFKHEGARPLAEYVFLTNIVTAYNAWLECFKCT